MFLLKRRNRKASEVSVRTPRTFEIPYERLEEFFRLWDAHTNARGSCTLEKFHLWNFVASIFPEVKHGSWSAKINNALSVTVTENLEGGE